MGLDQYITKMTSGKRGSLQAVGKQHYFRKFNNLHGWLEKHVGSIENQEDLIVPRRAWQELLKLTNRLLPFKDLLTETLITPQEGKPYAAQVITNPVALDIMRAEFPFTDGFFFGEVEYFTPFFFSDLEKLHDILLHEILSPDNTDYDDRVVVYTYRAWW